MAESYPFSSELLPYGPSIAICSSLRHSSAYLIRFAPLRTHGFKSDICMVCLGQNGHFRRKVSKYAALWQCPALPHQIGAFRPKAPQYAAARQHSSAYLATFAPLRMHRLNRTFAWCASVKTAMSEEGVEICSSMAVSCPSSPDSRPQAPSIAICSSTAAFWRLSCHIRAPADA